MIAVIVIQAKKTPCAEIIFMKNEIDPVGRKGTPIGNAKSFSAFHKCIGHLVCQAIITVAEWRLIKITA